MTFSNVDSDTLRAFAVARISSATLPRGYHSQEWDIVAKAPPNSRMQDFPLMLRSLLADRFQLTFHRETKELPVYELMVAKGVSKLKEGPPPAGGLGANRTAEGMTHWKGKVPLSTLADALTNALRMPVIDKTGIQGIFEIEFQHVPLSEGAPLDGGVLAASLPGPTISNALEQALGLKLELRRDRIEILVVDHLERAPTAN